MGKKSFKIEDSIYSLDIIRQAIADYSDYNIDLGEGEIFITGENKGEQEEIFNEFVNYCIALYNENL